MYKQSENKMLSTLGLTKKDLIDLEELLRRKLYIYIMLLKSEKFSDEEEYMIVLSICGIITTLDNMSM